MTDLSFIEKFCMPVVMVGKSDRVVDMNALAKTLLVDTLNRDLVTIYTTTLLELKQDLAHGFSLELLSDRFDADCSLYHIRAASTETYWGEQVLAERGRYKKLAEDHQLLTHLFNHLLAEFRPYLYGILGYSRSAIKTMAEEDQQKFRAVFEDMLHNSELMIETIKELKDISFLVEDRTQSLFGPCSLIEVLRESLKNIELDEKRKVFQQASAQTQYLVPVDEVLFGRTLKRALSFLRESFSHLNYIQVAVSSVVGAKTEVYVSLKSKGEGAFYENITESNLEQELYQHKNLLKLIIAKKMVLHWKGRLEVSSSKNEFNIGLFLPLQTN